MEIYQTEIPGVIIIEPAIIRDDRGFFVETYNRDRYLDAGIDVDWFQDNYSLSLRRGVFRGLHFQYEPFAQGKLVRVASGRVFDVAVDIRAESPMFGKWVGVELSGENQKQLFIPAGLAHGFVTLEDKTIFEYKCTKPYSKEYDSGILWNDPELAIAWPVLMDEAVLSEKDRRLQTFSEYRRKHLS